MQYVPQIELVNVVITSISSTIPVCKETINRKFLEKRSQEMKKHFNDKFAEDMA